MWKYLWKCIIKFLSMFYFFVQCSSGTKITMVLVLCPVGLALVLYPWAPVGLGRRWHQRVAGLADGLAGNRRHGGDLAALGTGEPPDMGVFTATAKICIYIFIFIYLHWGKMAACRKLQSLKVLGTFREVCIWEQVLFSPPCMVEKVTKCASLLWDFCAQVWDQCSLFKD